MKRCLGLVASLLLGSWPAADAAQLADKAELTAFVDGVVTSYMKHDEIPSAVVAVVHEGQVLLAAGYGQEDLDRPARIDPALSTFRIGSIAKLFTWTAVMQLVEQGRLDLDTDVNEYLQGLQLPRTYDAPVTLRSLMTHTAGFEEGALFYLTALDPRQQSSIKETMSRHMPARVRPPLTLPAYSNYGASLAGLIVEQVSGVPFNEYVQMNILAPLRMDRSTFEEPLPQALQAHAVSGYLRRNGEYVEQPFEIIGGWRPAGSASSTALDMTRFMLAYLQEGEYGGRRILRPETMALMHSPAFRMDDRFSGMGLGFYERSVNGLRIVGHAGDTDFFHSDLALIPERRFGVFISHVAGGGSGLRKALLKALADRYFPAPVRPPPAPAVLQDAHKYAGSYQPSRRNFSGIYKIFNLVMQTEVVLGNAGRLLIGDGDVARQFAAAGTDLFQEVGGDGRIAFRVDRNGRATHLFFDGTPFLGMERTPWYETTGVFLLLVGFCMMTFTATLISLCRRAFTADTPMKKGAAWIAGCTATFALVTVLAVAAVILALADAAFYGPPFSLKLVLLLPPVLVVATVLLIAAAVRVWSHGYWTRSQRILYTANGVAAAVLCMLFYQWNLFGWQFG